MPVEQIISYVSPFGQVFVHMLKMIVVPIIFFSLVTGASSLPIKRFGRIGLKTILWYLLCSLLAAILGTGVALLVNPGAGADLDAWQELVPAEESQAQELAEQSTPEGTLSQLLLNLFRNPFEALATGNFLPIIVFAIMFGLAMRVTMEGDDKQGAARLEKLAELLEACRDAMFKLVDWVLEYSPIGVLALTIVNFGLYGPSIVGPYVSVTIGVILGIMAMVFLVYPILLWIITRHSPLDVLKAIKEPMIMPLSRAAVRRPCPFRSARPKRTCISATSWPVSRCHSARPSIWMGSAYTCRCSRFWRPTCSASN